MDKVKLIAVMLLIILGLVSILSSTAVSWQVGIMQEVFQNTSSLLLTHYQCIQQAAGEIRQLGFISTDNGDPSWLNPNVSYYYFAQFSLAPRVLSNGLGAKTLIVGFYPDASTAAYVMARVNLVLVKDCGEGVLLLKVQKTAQ